MKKNVIAAMLALTMTLGVTALAGCSSAPAKEDINANTPAGAPPLMPASHADRFSKLSASGCYGCHGAGDNGNPMLADAVALPDVHYVDGDSSTHELAPTYMLCETCHVGS